MRPAEPLVMAVHGIETPDAAAPPPADARQVRAGRLKMLLVLLVCATPVVASYFTYFVLRPQARSNYGALIVPTRTMPTLALRSLEGAPVTAAALRGQWLLVAVGPVACVDACQRRLFTQRQLREMLGRERDRVDKVWFVTGDEPVAPALRDAVRTSPPVQALHVDAVALARWLEPEPGRRLDEHLYLVDPMGEWMMRLPVEPDPARVKRDLDRLLRASASWDTAGRANGPR